MSHADRPHGQAHTASTSSGAEPDLYLHAAVAQPHFAKGRAGRVITCSDRAAAGEYADRAGPVLVEALRRWGFETPDGVVVPDGDAVAGAIRASVSESAALVVTTGGTGAGPRDLTPQVTAPLLDFALPGIPEAVRAVGVRRGVPTSVLSRGVAGVIGRTIVVNLPGSVGAVRDGLDVLATVLPHLMSELGWGAPAPREAG